MKDEKIEKLLKNSLHRTSETFTNELMEQIGKEKSSEKIETTTNQSRILRWLIPGLFLMLFGLSGIISQQEIGLPSFLIFLMTSLTLGFYIRRVLILHQTFKKIS